ncbi:hypothetical protein MVEN_02574200 [Mycena venus]|uniref:Uncharacterized protein n=1 Tax=Mycena venus TaxID=2733690 RepID=A0A8H6U3S6_9AGAR|nr:hypothetical protein MVEN_02574200 [Mycena venus]
MQIPLAVWALSVAFALVAAQADEEDDPDFISSAPEEPPFPSNSVTSFFSSIRPSAAGSPAPLSSFAFPPTASFLTGFFPSTPTSFFPPAGSEAAATAFPSSGAAPMSVSGSTDFSRGPIIGAAVGGSIAASLVVLAGVLFCLRLRTRNTPAPPVEGASDVLRRCEALEREVSMLRERLARLEARGSGGAAAAATLYTNEKDGLTLDGKAVKDQPPSYLD